MSVFSHAISTNNYGPLKFIVSSSAANGTHTTIASAITAASSGDIISIRPGTYTENLTLKAGVILTSLIEDGHDAQLTPVTISGQIGMTDAGSAEIQGCNLTTNGADLISISGSSASNIRFYACQLSNASTFTILTLNNANCTVLFNSCKLVSNDGSTKVFNITTCSNVYVTYGSKQFNAAAASTIAAGAFNIWYSDWESPITTSGTAQFYCRYANLTQVSATTITCGGSGGHKIAYCQCGSGSASTFTINSAATIEECTVDSTNTNAITGSGTLTAGVINFPNTSHTINSTLTVVTESIYPINKTFNNIVTQVFTATGASTYTPTAGMKYCIVEVVGGGGGAGGVAATGVNQTAGTAGGGAGGYARKKFSAATIGASQTVTINTGGGGGSAGNNAGTAGGSVTFGALLSASGGSASSGGGVGSAFAPVGSASGVGSNGDFNASGGPGGGAIGFNTTVYAAFLTGAGGNSIYGGGGPAQAGGSGQTFAGANATGYGGGGGGAGNGTSQSAQGGGSGTTGICIVTEYINS